MINGSIYILINYLFYYSNQIHLWECSDQRCLWADNHGSATPTATILSDGSVKISITNTSSKYTASGCYRLVEDFDLTGYNTLTVECGDNSGFELVIDSRDSYWGTDPTYSDGNIASCDLTANGIATLDISGINGAVCIMFGAYIFSSASMVLKSLVVT